MINVGGTRERLLNVDPWASLFNNPPRAMSLSTVQGVRTTRNLAIAAPVGGIILGIAFHSWLSVVVIGAGLLGAVGMFFMAWHTPAFEIVMVEAVLVTRGMLYCGVARPSTEDNTYSLSEPIVCRFVIGTRLLAGLVEASVALALRDGSVSYLRRDQVVAIARVHDLFERFRDVTDRSHEMVGSNDESLQIVQEIARGTSDLDAVASGLSLSPEEIRTRVDAATREGLLQQRTRGVFNRKHEYWAITDAGGNSRS